MFTDITTPFPYPDHERILPVLDKALLVMGRGSYVNRSVIQHDEAANSSILIGNFTSIANGNTFLVGVDHPISSLSTYPMDTLGLSEEEWYEWIRIQREREWAAPKCQIMIGHDVWIGRGCTIMGGVRIGNGACVAAGSLVTKDVPPYALVGGVPAKVIRYRFPEEIIRQLQQIKWWYWTKEKIKDIVAKVKTPEEVIRFAREQEKISVPPPDSQLADYKQQGYRIFYFCPGKDSERLLSHVLDEYHRSFTQADKTCLLVDVTNDNEGYQAVINEAAERYEHKSPVISVILPSPGSVILEILQAADYLITNRGFYSVVLNDYAFDFGADLLYGLEEHPFEALKK